MSSFAENLDNELLKLRDSNGLVGYIKIGSPKWRKDDTGYTLYYKSEHISSLIKEFIRIITLSTGMSILIGVNEKIINSLTGSLGLTCKILVNLAMCLTVIEIFRNIVKFMYNSLIMNKLSYEVRKVELLHIDNNYEKDFKELYNRYTTNYVDQLLKNETIDENDKRDFYKVLNSFNDSDNNIKFSDSIIK